MKGAKFRLNKNQVFNRNNEKNLKFFLHFDRFQNIPIIYSSTTDFDLHLSGIIGYANLYSVMHKVCWSFANPRIGLISRTTILDDVKELKRREFNLGRFGRESWLSSAYIHLGSAYQFWGVYCTRDNIIERTRLVDSDGFYDSDCYGVRPALSILTSDIVIDKASFGKDGVWKLLPPEMNK